MTSTNPVVDAPVVDTAAAANCAPPSEQAARSHGAGDDDGAATAAPPAPPMAKAGSRAVRQVIHTVHVPARNFEAEPATNNNKSNGETAQPPASYAAGWGAAARGGRPAAGTTSTISTSAERHQAQARAAAAAAQRNTSSSPQTQSSRQEEKDHPDSKSAPFAWCILWMSACWLAIVFAMGTDLLKLTGKTSAKLTVADSRQRVTFWGIERCQMIGLRVDYCASRALEKALELDEITPDCVGPVRGAAACITLAFIACIVAIAGSAWLCSGAEHPRVPPRRVLSPIVLVAVALTALLSIIPVWIVDDALEQNWCFDKQVVPAEEYVAADARSCCIIAFCFALFTLITSGPPGMCPAASDFDFELAEERRLMEAAEEDRRRVLADHRRLVARVLKPPPPPVVAIAPPQPPAGPAAADGGADGDCATMAEGVVDGTPANAIVVSEREPDRAVGTSSVAVAVEHEPVVDTVDLDAVHVPEELLIPADEVSVDVMPTSVFALHQWFMFGAVVVGVVLVACLASRVDRHDGGTIRIGRFVDPNPNDYQLYWFGADECPPPPQLCETRTLKHVTSGECVSNMRLAGSLVVIALICCVVVFAASALTVASVLQPTVTHRVIAPAAIFVCTFATYAAFGALENTATRMYCLPFFLNGSRRGGAWGCLVAAMVLLPIGCVTALPPFLRASCMSRFGNTGYWAQAKRDAAAAEAAAAERRREERQARRRARAAATASARVNTRGVPEDDAEDPASREPLIPADVEQVGVPMSPTLSKAGTPAVGKEL